VAHAAVREDFGRKLGEGVATAVDREVREGRHAPRVAAMTAELPEETADSELHPVIAT
jgi:hypothetical protein